MRMALRRASTLDVLYVAPRLRADDRRECGLFVPEGSDLETHLMLGIRLSDIALAWVDTQTDRPVALLGTVPLSDRTASIWLFATDAVETAGVVQFLRTSRPVARLLAGDRAVGNYILKDNRLHRRWLQWTGLFEEAETHIIHNEEFIIFRSTPHG